jgi:hypothetical protein
MWEQIAPVALDGLQMVLIALIGLLCTYATVFINRLAVKAKVEAEVIEHADTRKMISDAIGRLKDLTLIVVGKIEETTAKKLREAVKDGKVDRQELVKLSHEAYKEIMATIDPITITLIETQIKDVETYIMGLIENAVRDVKGNIHQLESIKEYTPGVVINNG